MTDPRDKRVTIGPDEWAIYESEGDRAAAEGRWEYCDTLENAEDPGSACRIVAARKWTAGVHRMLAVGTRGAFEYRITLGTEGPVI